MIHSYFQQCARHSVSLPKCILWGAGSALALIISLMLITENNLALFRLIFAILFVTAAGGVGGIVFYITDSLRIRGGLYKPFANLLSIIIYLFILVVGFILSVNGPD